MSAFNIIDTAGSMNSNFAYSSLFSAVRDTLQRQLTKPEEIVVAEIINKKKDTLNKLGIPKAAYMISRFLEENAVATRRAPTPIITPARISENIPRNVDYNSDQMRSHMIEELKQPDNPTYFRDSLPMPENVDTATAVSKMSAILDNIFLRPVYVTNYITLDTKYLDWGSTNAPKSVLNFQLSANDNTSNNTTISLKYPLSDIIQFATLPFTIPPYAVKVSGGTWNGYEMVRCPSNKRIQITISELVETFKSTPAERYTILAKCEWDNTTYDGTNLPYVSKVEPVNEGIIVFRFVLKFMTNITISMNDFAANMYFPSPFITGITMTPGNPTVFTASTAGNEIGTFLDSGELIYITGFTSTSAADATLVTQINSPAGWIATAIGVYQFSIPLNSAAFAGTSATTWTATVNSRRSIIPLVVSQLRPNIFN